MRAGTRGFLLLLPLAVAAYAALAAWSNPAELWISLQRISGAALLAALLAALVNYALRWLRWRVYLRSLNHRVSAGMDVLTYAAGFAFTATPGKAGEAARSLYLKPLGVPYSHVVGACIAERLLDLASVIAISALVIWPLREYRWLVAAAIVLLAGGLLALAFAEGLGAWLARTFNDRAAWFGRVLAGGQRTLQVALRLLKGRGLVPGMGLGTAGWLAEASGFWMLAQAAGIDIAWPLAVGIYALGLLAGALSFLPGGLVGTEIAVTALLVHQGAPDQAAVAVTLVARVCTLWFSMALGAAALGLIHARASTAAPAPSAVPASNSTRSGS